MHENRIALLWENRIMIHFDFDVKEYIHENYASNGKYIHLPSDKYLIAVFRGFLCRLGLQRINCCHAHYQDL